MSQAAGGRPEVFEATSHELGGARAWCIWSLSALAFGYAFFQRVAPSVMVDDLMAEFAVGAAVLGQLSALYYYPYALLQIPIGMLLDRFGARLLLSTAVAVAALGSILFGLSRSLEWALAGRFLIGVGSAVGFIASMALAAKWFPPHRFALLTGLAMFFAMACGIAGQAPLAAAVEAIGWRSSMVASGLFAGLLALAVAIFVRNAPASAAGQRSPRTSGALYSGSIFRSGKVWLIGTVAAAMCGPILTFGGLWGVPYFMAAYDLERPQAAFLTSLGFVGWALGAPFAGWASDFIRRRKLPLVIGASVLSGALALLALAPDLPLWTTILVTFLIGFAGGQMSTSFALAREVTPTSMHGSVLGIVNGMTVGAGALLQPIVGLMLDSVWSGAMQDGARLYQAADYRYAFIALLVWSSVGLAGSLFLPETRCRPHTSDSLRDAAA
jgi:MFS family permease